LGEPIEGSFQHLVIGEFLSDAIFEQV